MAIFGRVGNLLEEFDSVEVDHFSPDYRGCMNKLFLPGRTEYNFDIASCREIGRGEHVHTVLTQVESRAFDERGAHSYLNGHGDPSPLCSSLIWNRSEE